MARRGFAALLRTDAADDQAADALFGEPDVESCAHQRAVAALEKARGRRERVQTAHWHDVAGFERKRVICVGWSIGVQDPDDGNAALRAAGNQGILDRQVRFGCMRDEIRTVAKRLLHIDHNQTRFHGMLPLKVR